MSYVLANPNPEELEKTPTIAKQRQIQRYEADPRRERDQSLISKYSEILIIFNDATEQARVA